MSDTECARVLAEFNCGANMLNRNGSNHSINADMAEISNQAVESSKDVPAPAVYKVYDNKTPFSCDVESLAALINECHDEDPYFSVGVCVDQTLGVDENLVNDNSSDVCDSENSEGGHVKESVGERHAGDTSLREEGCPDNSSSCTEGQNEEENVQESQQGESSGLQQLCMSETESCAHVHIKSSVMNSAETFNTFQYWRVPIPELQLEISGTKTDSSTAELTVKTMEQTSASELHVEMDIDVSSLQCMSYTVRV